MPYISKSQRSILQSTLNVEDFIERLGSAELCAGDLNYLVTRIINRYFEINHNYAGANDILGALEGAKLEFYRRKLSAYEDSKINNPANGDV